MYVCVKQAYRNSATNIKVSIFILYSKISSSFVSNLSPSLSFVQTKRLVLPVVLCISDASLVIADNCDALGLIPPPARRSVSACLISYQYITGALVKFLICHSLLLSLDQELANLSLPLAFSSYP